MSEGVASNQPNNRPATGGITGKGFMPGRSGNPAGRRKNDVNLVELAKTHTREAVETLVRVMRTAPRHADQAGAAMALLDRAWGRPAQMILGDPSRPVAIDFRWADDQPIEPGAAPRVAARVIDAVFDDASPAPEPDDSK